MGIPGLKRHLQPYATCVDLDSCDVVIDGPALAYHVLYLCLARTSRTSPFELPQYSLLGDTAIAWLDQLRTCGVSVSAVFFDGYLPEYKTQERKKRLAKLFRTLTDYFSSHPTGLPSGRPGRGRKVVLFPTSSSLGSREALPIPAFTVPAILEALKTSEQYSHLIKVVPGEADGFCARHVRSHGGIVLTSDSDLLVHDLGQNGSVAFISDVEMKLDLKKTLVASEYLPARICARLSIPPDKGIQALAFELSSSTPLSLEQSVERSRTGVALSTSPEAYAEFLRQYLLPEIAEPNSPNPLVLDLDPRISELVLEVIVLSARYRRPTSDDDLDSEDHIEDASMYLPFLLDSPSRTSSWVASKSVRQLSYGLLQTLIGRPIGEVVEFRRLQTPSGGVHVEVPQPSSLDSVCLDLVEVVSRIREITTQPEILWVMLSVYYDSIISVSQGKRLPLSIQVLQMEARGALATTSWEFVHFLAQVQGTLYSLRMLQQVMDFVFIQADKERPASFAELRSYLSGIPPLCNFPQLQNFAPLLQQIVRSRCLEAFAAAFQFPEDVLEEIMRVLHPEKGKRPKAPKQAPPIREGPLSNNPFDILGLE